MEARKFWDLIIRVLISMLEEDKRKRTRWNKNLKMESSRNLRKLQERREKKMSEE
jgi:hypothetical protein